MGLEDNILLRTVSDPNLTAKGSALTWVEEDNNFIIIANEIRDLKNIDTSNFEAYNSGTTYKSGDFVSHEGNIYQFIGGVPESGVTPGTDPLKWELSSQGQFTHQQNTDQYLDKGGLYEVSAEDVYNSINNPASPITVSNGLTRTGDNITLEGTLTKNTTIDLAAFDIKFTAGGFDLFTFDQSSGIFGSKNGYAIDGFNVLKYDDATGNLQLGPSPWDVETAGSGNLSIGRNNLSNMGVGTVHNTVVGQSSGGGIIAGLYNIIQGFNAANAEDMVGCLLFGEQADSLKGSDTLYSMAFGVLAAIRGDNELVFGASGRPISSIFFGEGQGNTSNGNRPETFNPVYMYAQGDCQTGTDVDVRAGIFYQHAMRSRGAFDGSDWTVRSSPAGASGSTVNPWVNAFTVAGNSDIRMEQTTASFIIGDGTTNGNWKFKIDGTDLIFERREAGVWVEKYRMPA